MQLEDLAPPVRSHVPFSTPVLYLSPSMRCDRVYLFYIERARTLFRRREHPRGRHRTEKAMIEVRLDNVFDSTTLGPGRLGRETCPPWGKHRIISINNPHFCPTFLFYSLSFHAPAAVAQGHDIASLWLSDMVSNAALRGCVRPPHGQAIAPRSQTRCHTQGSVVCHGLGVFIDSILQELRDLANPSTRCEVQ